MLLKTVVLFLPVSMLFIWTTGVFLRTKTVASLLQLVGAAFLSVVVLTHVCEARHLLPWMGWGDEQSPGHYLDLVSAILGLTLLPLGILFHALKGCTG